MRRLSRTRKWISNVLLLAGIAAIGIWVWSLVRGAAYQSRANEEFDEETHSAPSAPSSVPPSALPAPAPRPAAPSAPPSALHTGTVIGRLEIPRLHLQAIVREGTDAGTLDVALGHIPGTAMPGRSGNAAIAGHRDTLFRGLRHITKDDLIVFQTTQGSYNYSVEDISIVKPKDVSVLAAGDGSEITLVTCFPFSYIGSAPDRFIVRGRLLPTSPTRRPVKPGSPGPLRRAAAGKKLLARRAKSPAPHSALRSLDE